MQIEKLSGTELDLELLVNLLKDAVGSGASIGFLPPLNTKAAKDYWRTVHADIRGAARVLLIVRSGDVIAGAFAQCH